MEEILCQAEQSEKEYDWSGAAESYAKALNLLAEDDFLSKGETQERLAYAFYHFAFQAENKDEFRERLRQSAVAYEKAAELYGKLNEPEKTARTSRCNAMIACVGYWLSPEAKEKKKKIDECWKLTKDALRAFKEVGEGWEYGKTYAQLSKTSVFKFCLDSNFETRKTVIREAVEQGEQAIRFLSTLEDPHELATAYAGTASYLGAFGYYFTDLDEKEILFQKAKTYWRKAKELDEEAALLEVLYPFFGPHLALWGEATPEAFSNLERALEQAKKNKDKFIIGSALDWLTYHTAWTTGTIDNYDEVIRVVEKAFQYAEDAKQCYSVISFISPRADNAWVEALQAQFMPGYRRETDPAKKRDMLRKAIEAARDVFRRAEDSGYPEVIAFVHTELCDKLTQLAEIETNIEEKKKLLEEALRNGKEYARITEQFRPLEYWDNGWALTALASIKYTLSSLTNEPENKKNRLQEAIVDRQTALSLLIKALSVVGKRSPMLFGALANSQFSEGVWLSQLYKLTSDKENLRKSAEFFGKAVESFEKVQRTSRIAECYWKAAQVYSELDEHLRAADDFALASGNYKNAAEKIPQLKSLYQDHASYMLAWTEIETARHHHERQEYGLAKEHFEKAAELQRPLKQWGYLEPNYRAWAQVEKAEELSRREQSEEAIKAFRQASSLFIETKKSIQTQFDKIESADEKQMTASVVKTTDLRREYCAARIALEEARILDKKGDHYSSSERYGSAAEQFEKMGQTLESEQERREMKFITTLSRAWQKMTMAEAKSSPTLYVDASQLFEQAEDFSPNEKTKMLVLGHSRFCKALEAGTKFSDTANATLHETAIQQLESAAKYYMKAEFQNASEYARATKLLFDAYLYMDNAEKENDPEKKARLYVMAEKVLQTSAGSYAKAEHPEKMEQVLKLLEKVKEERELAVSLIEVIHGPAIVSATTSFSAPTPTREQAVGSERFEHADIQTNLIIRQKELRIGENLSIELELVNAGKGFALLTKVTEIIPEGFELTEKSDNCRVEDSYLNLKGKRLDPLKTEEVRLVLKPTARGTFSLKPTVLYLDENGKYRSHEPEPVMIVVRELGVKGWLKGGR